MAIRLAHTRVPSLDIHTCVYIVGLLEIDIYLHNVEVLPYDTQKPDTGCGVTRSQPWSSVFSISGTLHDLLRG